MEYLPELPAMYGKRRPTENEVERVASWLMDKADKVFMSGKATQAEYDLWVKALDKWARSIPLAR